jgi:hypothetical protein
MQVENSLKKNRISAPSIPATRSEQHFLWKPVFRTERGCIILSATYLCRHPIVIDRTAIVLARRAGEKCHCAYLSTALLRATESRIAAALCLCHTAAAGLNIRCRQGPIAAVSRFQLRQT